MLDRKEFRHRRYWLTTHTPAVIWGSCGELGELCCLIQWTWRSVAIVVLERSYPARRASGIRNWDQPRHTTCRGRPIWAYPTYSAFWSVFGVTCLRLQRLAASVGFRAEDAIGDQEEPAGFRRKLRVYRMLRCSGPFKPKSRNWR